MAWSTTSRSKGLPVEARRMLGRGRAPAALAPTPAPAARSAVCGLFVTAGPSGNGLHPVLTPPDPVDGQVRQEHEDSGEVGGKHVAHTAVRAPREGAPRQADRPHEQV